MFHINNDGQDNKHLLRYPEERLPDTRIEQIPPLVVQESKDDLQNSKITTLPPASKKVDLAVPKLNTSLCIENKIRKTEGKKAKKLKNVSELSQVERVTFDEKITKQMNFPFDKKLYKELISLNINAKTTFHQPTSYEPVLKDKIPKLEDYFTPPPNFEYSIPIKSNLGSQTAIRQYDGLRIDKIIRTWKDNRPD